MLPDFPFYKGTSAKLEGRGWACLLISVGVAFAALTLIPAGSFPATLLPPLLFVGIPLATLAYLTGEKWKTLFGPVRGREIGLMGLFALASITVSVLVALLISKFGTTAPNPVVEGMDKLSGADFVLRLVPTFPQLIGEELLTILPFLAVLWLTTQRLGWSRKAGIVTAIIVSSLLFAAAHLPTYDWHWAQCFGVIGMARVVMTLAYVWTRNLWVTSGAHILNDWVEFTFSFGLSHLPIGTE